MLTLSWDFFCRAVDLFFVWQFKQTLDTRGTKLFFCLWDISPHLKNLLCERFVSIGAVSAISLRTHVREEAPDWNKSSSVNQWIIFSLAQGFRLIYCIVGKYFRQRGNVSKRFGWSIFILHSIAYPDAMQTRRVSLTDPPTRHTSTETRSEIARAKMMWCDFLQGKPRRALARSLGGVGSHASEKKAVGSTCGRALFLFLFFSVALLKSRFEKISELELWASLVQLLKTAGPDEKSGIIRKNLTLAEGKGWHPLNLVRPSVKEHCGA